jgi:REP element-mobilizing transposase RayT
MGSGLVFCLFLTYAVFHLLICFQGEAQMSRPLRLEYAGALYHITSRGDRSEDIYDVNEDRERFLALLGEVCDRYNWVTHAYCLMSNHYHLLVETPDANLSKGMRQLNGVYTQYYNRYHSRVGHVFQGRYKAILVDKECYLLELARYIVLNPVRADRARSAQEWRWSSYRATTGYEACPEWLHTDWLLAAFGKRKSTAIKAYKQFIAEGKGQPSPWQALNSQIYLGDGKFVKKMKGLISDEQTLSEIPATQRRAKPDSLKSYEKKADNRDLAITKAYASGGYSMKEIGDYFGLHYSRVSRILKKAKDKT